MQQKMDIIYREIIYASRWNVLFSNASKKGHKGVLVQPNNNIWEFQKFLSKIMRWFGKMPSQIMSHGAFEVIYRIAWTII